MSPLSEWILFASFLDAERLVTLPKSIKELVVHAKRLLKSRFLQSTEVAFYKAAGPLLADRHEPPISDTVLAGQRYLPFHVGGEALVTLGRAVHFALQGAALVVNASPFGCMAGTVSAALFARMENELKVPVVSSFYDGCGDENRRIAVFLSNIERADARSAPPLMSPRTTNIVAFDDEGSAAEAM